MGEGPFAGSAAVGRKKATRGFPFRTSAFPTGDGTHHIQVNAAMREGAGGIGAGGRATIEIEVDTRPRTVAVPPALRKALAKYAAAKAAFEKLPPSHRKEIVGYITEAKKPETVERRVARTVEALKSGSWRAK